MNLQPLQTFIQERIGLHFGGDTGIQWRALLLQRIEHAGAGSPEAYLARLHHDDAELHALTSLLTINETYFYREPQHLKLLTEQLCPARLASQPLGVKVRILSVGCSTGEEPYSILIALRERYGELANRLFEVNAGDVDQVALARARAGRFGPFAFRALPPHLAERYFTPLDNGEREINAAIRQQAQFQPFNLLAPSYPPDLQGQDVIFFRNVSIYFDAATREHVLKQLKGLLSPGGALIVGIAETLANDCGVLALCEQDGLFFFRDAPLPPPRAEMPLVTPAPPKITSAPAITPKPIRPLPTAMRYQEALALAQSERFAEALARLASGADVAPLQAPELALQSHLLLERGDPDRAVTAAQQALALDPWCLDALLLLARIAQDQGDSVGAIAHLRRAIYHRPHSWRAHFQLAEIYRHTDQHALARREYRVLLLQLHALTTTGHTEHADTSLLPSPLSLHDLRLLCETRLAQLDALAD